MTDANQLKINATPVFFANKRAYEGNYPVICNEGGTRSSKSYSIVQLLIEIAYNNPKTRISIVSHSLPHIKRGVYRDFKSIMENWGLWQDNDFSFSDFIYTYPNGKMKARQEDQQGMCYL
jgi:phage terminase large subunit